MHEIILLLVPCYEPKASEQKEFRLEKQNHGRVFFSLKTIMKQEITYATLPYIYTIRTPQFYLFIYLFL